MDQFKFKAWIIHLHPHSQTLLIPMTKVQIVNYHIL